MSRVAHDIFGNVLNVGDVVATLKPRFRYSLVRATIVAITPERLRVKAEGADESHVVADSTVAKRAPF